MRTNHYLNPQWTYGTPSDADSWNSIARLSNMSALAEKYKGQIDVPLMKSIMSIPLAEGGPCHNLTRYQIVAVPEDMTLHIYLPYRREWVELHMSEHFR